MDSAGGVLVCLGWRISRQTLETDPGGRLVYPDPPRQDRACVRDRPLLVAGNGPIPRGASWPGLDDEREDEGGRGESPLLPPSLWGADHGLAAPLRRGP